MAQGKRLKQSTKKLIWGPRWHFFVDSVTHFTDSLCDRLKDLLFILEKTHRNDFTDSRREFRQAWKKAFCTAAWNVLLLSDIKIVLSLYKQPFFRKTKTQEVYKPVLKLSVVWSHDRPYRKLTATHKVRLQGHFYRGKWPFYHGKLHLERVTDISQGNLTW